MDPSIFASGAGMPAPSTLTGRELRIFMAGSFRFSTWEGSSEQLRAEGVLPAGVKLPLGRRTMHLEDERWSTWLQRRRPKGWKGAWSDVDHWHVQRRYVPDKSPIRTHAEELLREAESALTREQWLRTADGKRWLKLRDAARQDRAFQTFLAFVAGRKPKSNE